MPSTALRRVFKTPKFASEARRADIGDGEYAGATERHVANLVSAKQFVEICHDDEA